MAEPADLLLLGGDFISDAARYMRPLLALLGERAMRFPLGAFAVLGNHDYTVGADRVARELSSCGVQVLRNGNAPVEWNGVRLWMAGMDDALLGNPSVPDAMAGIPDGSFVISLWHEGDWAEETARAGASLQLSGHSHGGQVRLPGIGSITAPEGGRRWVIGWHDVEGMPLYVSRGLGTYRPPVRFRCRPEVTRIILRVDR
jgi:uncharacterized protein